MTKVAVVGAGYWGKNLIRNFDALGVLGAICDNRPEVRETFGKMYPHTRMTDSFPTVLNDPAVEAVAIASPAEMHYRMVKEGLLADKHVFVEKPLALHEEEGIELHELAEQRKKPSWWGTRQRSKDGCVHVVFACILKKKKQCAMCAERNTAKRQIGSVRSMEVETG